MTIDIVKKPKSEKSIKCDEANYRKKEKVVFFYFQLEKKTISPCKEANPHPEDLY